MSQGVDGVAVNEEHTSWLSYNIHEVRVQGQKTAPPVMSMTAGHTLKSDIIGA